MSLYDQLINEGLQKGKLEGITEGIEKGIEQGIEKTIINAFDKGLDIKTIELFTGKNVAEIKATLKMNNRL